MFKLRRLVTATAGISALALSCSSTNDSPGGQGGAPGQGGSGTGGAAQGGAAQGGAPQGGAPSGGSGQGGSGQGGAANGGAANGGMTTGQGGSGQGGSAQGGGTSTGGGSSSGGKSQGGGTGSSKGGGTSTGGGSSSGGSGGGSSVTFAQVASLLSMKCGGCHTATGGHVDLATMNGLYMRLTTALPASQQHCGGTTLVVPNDAAGSFLAKIVQGGSMCTKGSGMESIPRMPDACSATSSNPRACLTAAEIKVITDWISGGAKQ